MSGLPLLRQVVGEAGASSSAPKAPAAAASAGHGHAHAADVPPAAPPPAAAVAAAVPAAAPAAAATPPSAAGGGLETEQLLCIETNIDDMNPQLFEPIMAQVRSRGLQLQSPRGTPAAAVS